jgi:hypothetical protein
VGNGDGHERALKARRIEAVCNNIVARVDQGLIALRSPR